MLHLQSSHGFRLKFDSSTHFPPFLLHNPFSFHRISKTLIPPSQTRSIPKPISSKFSEQHHSFTISYLTNSCGLLPESAITASEKVQLQNPKNPDSVLALFKSHGFSNFQISKLVKKRPALLLSNPNQTLLPKLEFFYSIGVSRSDLATSLASDPTVLTRSLENQIIPSYRYLKSVLLSDAKVVAALKRTFWIFLDDYSKSLMPNIGVLRDEGVPESCVILLLVHFPETLIQKTNIFAQVVAEIKKMGFDPKKSTFVLAIHAVSGKGNKSIWNRCYGVYRKWGWSRDEILMAFKKHPHCMMLSEKKISRAMEFFVEKMGQSSGMIAKKPVILFFSLEKRIIPRCCVIRVLMAKGLMKKEVSLTTVLLPAEKRFLDTFVSKYLEQVPQLLNLYRGEVDFDEVLVSNLR